MLAIASCTPSATESIEGKIRETIEKVRQGENYDSWHNFIDRPDLDPDRCNSGVAAQP
jgi:hypothetical protein